MKITKHLFLSLVVTFISCSLHGRPLSIAHHSNVTTSFKEINGFEACKLVDGITAVEKAGNWMTAEKEGWIQLSWASNKSINKIVFYNYPLEAGQITKGKVLFSDNSSIDVNFPADGTAISIEFPTKITDYVRFIPLNDGKKIMGLSEIEIFPAPDQFEDYVSWVDPYIETNKGRFFFFITGSRPFGLVSAAPMTINGNNNGGGYAYKSTEILGFPQIHSWTISGINLMPTLASIDPTLGENNWKSAFKHDDEIVQPGYHRVYLKDHNVWVEQTSTDRVSFYNFTWTKDTLAQILLSLGGKLGNSSMTDAKVKRMNNTEFEGSVSSIDRAYNVGPIDVKLFFVIQFDKPFQSFNGWDEKVISKDIFNLRTNNGGVASIFEVKSGEEIKMKIAVSYTSIENARKNLVAECNTWDFNKVQKESRDTWNDWLGKINVEGGTDAQRIKFYTDLWHVLLGRQKINDVSGDYPDRTEGPRYGIHGYLTDAVFKIKNVGENKDGTLKHNMYNSDAFWLTQWNLNVLWGLAWPEIQDDMSASMLAYANNGKLLPRGPAGGGYTYIMTGCPATNLIVSAYMKGVLTKADANNAFEMIKINHFPGGMLGGGEFFKHDLEFYIENGWWPDNAGITIEASFQDWGAAQMAKKMGNNEDYLYFMRRSESWKKCYNAEQKLLFPVNREGDFVHADPLHHWGFVEANAWQATWGVSHDIPGLARLMGGNTVLVNKLDYAFKKAQDSDFVYSYSEGYVSYANQPGCSNAHVFNYAKAPWLTQYWVRKVKEQAYGGITPDIGYGGHDEDQGQMGGVSALMAIGLFSIIGTESIVPFYEITSPIFDKITISLDKKYYDGDKFEIITHDNKKDNFYIQKAKLNNKPLKDFWFTHDVYSRGGKLEIWLGPKPNKKWGVKNQPPINSVMN